MKQILGEMLDNGVFRVMRFHNGFTDIVGSDFGIICGNCKEAVFIRKGGDGTNSNIRLQYTRIYSRVDSWGGSVNAVGTL